jgi:hypothetical protein
MVEAHFATRNVDVNVEFISELQHPKIGRISGDFKTEKVSKFTFGNLQMREMDDLIRIKIDRFLEQMKATRWKEYDGSIRRVFMITELYYGTIRMVIERKFSTELETILDKWEVQASVVSEGSHAVNMSSPTTMSPLPCASNACVISMADDLQHIPQMFHTEITVRLGFSFYLLMGPGGMKRDIDTPGPQLQRRDDI